MPEMIEVSVHCAWRSSIWICFGLLLRSLGAMVIARACIGKYDVVVAIAVTVACGTVVYTGIA